MPTVQRRTWLASASLAAVCLGLAATPALARQDAAQPAQATLNNDAVSEVVVTGFRSGLAKALNVKRQESAAVDSILVEDIGKFPDLNLSESIQRIPGVALRWTVAR